MTLSPSRWWWFAAAIAVVPFYGYVAHAARDDPSVALLITLCWVVTCLIATVTTVRAVARPQGSVSQRRRQAILAGCLCAAAVLGWGGVRVSFYELLAG